jgi:DNA-binding response OmpR family regulator
MFVLVVDDDEISRNAATQALHRSHIGVVSVAGALQAIEFLTNRESDVALIDYVLEGGPNGLNLAAQVRRLYPSCAITMISAYADIHLVRDAMRIGCDDFLLKPVPETELVSSLCDALMRRRTYFPGPTLTKISDGDLEVDLAKRLVKWRETDIKLTPTQFKILAQLISRPGHVFSFADLISLSSGEHLDPVEARKRLKTHMVYLRERLEKVTKQQMICNVHGMGYKWESEANPAEQSKTVDAV